MSKTLEQILTAEELAELKKHGFNSNRIDPEAQQIGPLLLVGEHLTGAGTPWKEDGPVGELPQCKQKHLGSLYFHVLTNNRRIVEFRPDGPYQTMMPQSYVFRGSDGQFWISQFPTEGATGQFERYGDIAAVRTDERAESWDKILASQNIPGWLSINLHRDATVRIAFNDSQWKLITSMLDAWLPAE